MDLSYDFSNNWFNITAKEIWDKHLPNINPRKILEIGSFEGASACYLVQNCTKTGPIELHCIDTWEGGIEHVEGGFDMGTVERRFRANIKYACGAAANSVNLHIHKGYSNHILAGLTTVGMLEHFDFIYIDGSHQAPDVLTDAIMAFPLLNVGGSMVFDDYIWRDGSGDLLRQPKAGIDAFLNIFFHKMRVSWAPNSQVFAVKTSR